MIRVSGPVYSLRSHGWLGRWTYGRLGVCVCAYPIGIQPRWLTNSMYYNPMGWCYQVRRTWHGIVNTALRPPFSVNKKSPYQLGHQNRFAAAVYAWQGISEPDKRIWRSYKHPRFPSGYNKFITHYIKTHSQSPVYPSGYLLLETGDKMLLEDGGGILL